MLATLLSAGSSSRLDGFDDRTVSSEYNKSSAFRFVEVADIELPSDCVAAGIIGDIRLPPII